MTQRAIIICIKQWKMPPIKKQQKQNQMGKQASNMTHALHDCEKEREINYYSF